MSLSTYTSKKINESNITYSFEYCMLIVLSSLLMWILCALLAIFSIYIFCFSSSLVVFLIRISYFNWGILWGTIFTIVFFLFFLCLGMLFWFFWSAVYMVYSLSALSGCSETHFPFYEPLCPCGQEQCLCVGVFPGFFNLNGALWFGFHGEQCSQSFLQTGFAVQTAAGSQH